MDSILPLVTVLIPAYNAEGTIRRALDSALGQDYPAKEIIVVDDGSMDATSDVVANYASRGVRLVQLPCNLGEGGVLNEGLARAQGKYIAFLDADDEWLPQKLMCQVEVLERNPRAVMVTCGCRFVDGNGRVRENFGRKPPGFAKDQIWRALLGATYIAKPCVVTRASALAKVGPFDTTVRIAADQDMWIRLALVGEVEFVDEFLTIAHDTPGSLTKVYRKDEDLYGLKVVWRHICANRDKLSDEEKRSILVERYTSIGRNVYFAGRLWRGARLLGKAIALGGHPSENVWYLVTASPIAKKLKGLLHLSDSMPDPRQPELVRGSLLRPLRQDLAELPPGPPILIVGVDVEAEFDWNGPRPRSGGVANVREQVLADRIFERHGVRPVYLLDYEVATKPAGYEPLRDLMMSGKCEIGAHLQSWETPPFLEELNPRTSYNNNLPVWLQKQKLQRLTEAIELNVGVRPVTYRAGRYGIGEEIASILRSFDYKVDMSVVPGLDLRHEHGPDFRSTFERPYWFGIDQDLLEIPITTGLCGVLAPPILPPEIAAKAYRVLSLPALQRVHVPGIFARSGLLERITLTPEGITIDEMKRLLKKQRAYGQRTFTLSYHSSSLLPGFTPYVRTSGERDQFLRKLEEFLDLFLGELQGIAMTASELRTILCKPVNEKNNGDSVV